MLSPKGIFIQLFAMHNGKKWIPLALKHALGTFFYLFFVREELFLGNIRTFFQEIWCAALNTHTKALINIQYHLSFDLPYSMCLSLARGLRCRYIDSFRNNLNVDDIMSD